MLLHKRILSIIFSLVCILGFLIQLDQVSEVYFSFQTTTRIEYLIKETENYQTIFFCPRYFELINRTEGEKFGIKPHPPADYFGVVEEVSTLTVKQVMDLTPDPHSVIYTCSLRDSRVSTISVVNWTECSKFFSISKAVNGERICYRFLPKALTNYSVGDVASSVTHMNLVYGFTFTPLLSKTVFAIFISDFVDPQNLRDPLYSRLFSSKSINFEGFHKLSFSVYGEMTEIIRLPPPYDTRCTPNHDRQYCYEQCLEEKLKVVNRLPGSGFHWQHLEIKVFTQKDYFNKTMEYVAQKAFCECHKSCKIKTECNSKFSRTSIQAFFSNNFYVASMVPATAHISSTTVPLLTLIEYVIQVGSCCGIWFGLSIISFNPIKLAANKRKQTVKVVPQKLFSPSKRIILRRPSIS